MIEWMDCKIPMLTHSDRMQAGVHSIEDALLNQEDEEAETIHEAFELIMYALKGIGFTDKVINDGIKELENI